MPSGLLCIDSLGKCIFANNQIYDYLNLPPSQLLDRNLNDLLASDNPLGPMIKKATNDQTSRTEYALPWQWGQTDITVIDIRILPLDDTTGKLSVFLTDRSNEMRILHKRIGEGAALSVAGASAMLAHEIRNPLSGIRGAAQLLDQDQNADGKVLTQLICKEVDRIKGLINRMEVFSDQRKLECQRVNIHDVLERVKVLAAAGFARDISIREVYDPSLPFILGNQNYLIQLFLNLIKNAAEAIQASGRPDGEIILTTSWRAGRHIRISPENQQQSLSIEICVIDNGFGIDSKIADHLFEPFVTTKDSGTGLGLALCAKVVRDHNGLIEVQRKRYHNEERTIMRVMLPFSTNQNPDDDP